MRQKKGQAAMEFLMTYGWAILAAIIAIGVLAYFGVFSPGQYVGSSTVVTAPWYANAWNVQSTTQNISLEVQNNGGEDLNITHVKVALTDPSAATCVFNAGSYLVAASALQVVNVQCPASTISAGDTVRGDITITYFREGSSLNLTSTGSVTATAA